MRSGWIRVGCLFGLLALIIPRPAASQAPPSEVKVEGRGAAVFNTVCAACHDSAGSRAPATATLRRMNPTAIYRVLTVGPMRVQTQAVSDADKKAVAEYLAGANISSEAGLTPPAYTGASARFDSLQVPAFSSWDLTLFNTRNISAKVAGINRKTVGRLKLK